jgi:hypothetical protein
LGRDGVQLTNRWTDVPDGQHELALMLDVIEHVEDDRAFLRDCVGPKLEPTAQALITVPAFDALFSQHDRDLGHFRRYDRASLQQVLAAARFVTTDGGYLFLSLLPLHGLRVLLERARGPVVAKTGVGGWRGGMLGTFLAHRALCTDNRLTDWLGRHRLRLPGLSVWALCRR